jgi:hypothetical protein
MRFARDEEVATWVADGWVLLDGMIDTDEIDRAVPDLWHMFPTPDEYHADPEQVSEAWLGRAPEPRDEFVWPPKGPGFRPEQHRWKGEFPMPGSGALNRLAVHPAVVDFAERALATQDIRIYQTQCAAKYTGAANYEQPMHTDRNHSWIPLHGGPPWSHLETFLYLSDVFEGYGPTRMVSARDAMGRDPTQPLLMPQQDPEIYASEQAAAGVRGSLLAYRSDVWHRAVDITAPGGARFLLNVSFKRAGHDWIGFHGPQSKANSPHWVAFVEASSPRELELFGFPPPGHPVWDDATLEATARRYPRLDLAPWRS